MLAQAPDGQDFDDQFQDDGGFNLFTPVLTDDYTWSSTEATRHEFRENSLDYSDSWIRESSSFSAAAAIAHPVNVFIPDLDGYVTFHFVHSETHINGITSYILEPGGSNPQGVPPVSIPPCFGLLVLAEDASGLTGYLQTDTDAYLIKPVNAEKSILYKRPRVGSGSSSCNYCSSSHDLDATNYSEVMNNMVRAENLEPNKTGGSGFTLDDATLEEYISAKTCTIDLYIGATPRALLHSAGGPVAANVVSVMNRALFNSKAREVRYRLAGYSDITALEFFTPSPAATATGIVEMDPQVIALMESSGADVFMLLTQPQSFLFDGANGIAEIRNTTAPVDRNTVIANIDSELSFTPQHELAHNHGCKHNNDDRNLPNGVSELRLSARGAIVDGTAGGVFESTIMSVDVSWLPNGHEFKAGTRVLHFSNPDVTWGPDDLPTGSATRNNVEQLDMLGCFMSEFADRAYSGVMISGTTETEPGTTETFTTETKCPDGATASMVKWFVSIDGGPFTYLGQNSGTLDYQMPQNSRSVTLQAKITCNGLDFSDFQTVYVNEPYDPCAGHEALSEPKSSFEEHQVAILQGDQIVLNSSVISSSKVDIIFSDLLGRELYRYESTEGSDRISIPPNLLSGTQNQVIIVSVIDEDGAIFSSKIHLNK
ncbi:MAG: hypothetical protein AB8F78_00425 [Saprospiraceae bacterium]